MPSEDKRWFKCLGCNAEYPFRLVADAICPECGALALVSVEYDKSLQENVTRESIKKSNTYNMWRYHEFLPIDKPDIVSMGEGLTPLVLLNSILKEKGVTVLAKNEGVNPTDSFKDRGSSVLISWLKKNDIKKIAVHSSGNFASSMAAYAARAGMQGYVFIPYDAGLGKIVQSNFHGSIAVSLEGSRVLLDKYAEELGIHLCSHSPISWEGPKTIGYEVSEQLEWEPPDWFAFPSGTYTGLTGCWKGFRDFHNLDIIERMPGIVGISTEGAPIVEAFKKKSKEIERRRARIKSVAGPISSGGVGSRGKLALQAMYETNGMAEEVTDEEIMGAAKYLAKSEGLFVEPSSAASVAGIIKLIEAGSIDRGDTVVCVLTGSGFKTLDKYEQYAKKPILIEPTKEGLTKVFRMI